MVVKVMRYCHSGSGRGVRTNGRGALLRRAFDWSPLHLVLPVKRHATPQLCVERLAASERLRQHIGLHPLAVLHSLRGCGGSWIDDFITLWAQTNLLGLLLGPLWIEAHGIIRFGKVAEIIFSKEIGFAACTSTGTIRCPTGQRPPADLASRFVNKQALAAGCNHPLVSFCR